MTSFFPEILKKQENGCRHGYEEFKYLPNSNDSWKLRLFVLTNILNGVCYGPVKEPYTASK